MTPSKKWYFLETAWSYKLKFSGLSSFYDTNNWWNFKENLRCKGDNFNFFWMIWYGTTQTSVEFMVRFRYILKIFLIWLLIWVVYMYYYWFHTYIMFTHTECYLTNHDCLREQSNHKQMSMMINLGVDCSVMFVYLFRVLHKKWQSHTLWYAM